MGSNSHQQSSNVKEDDNVFCEKCDKLFKKSTLLKHIAKVEACKNHYGKRFEEPITGQFSDLNVSIFSSVSVLAHS